MSEPTDKRLSKAIELTKETLKKPRPRKVKFRGNEITDSELFQNKLNSMSTDNRVYLFTDDICHMNSHRLNQMVEEYQSTEDEKERDRIKADGRAILEEVGTLLEVVEDPDLYDEDEGLDWVSERYINRLYESKRANSLFMED